MTIKRLSRRLFVAHGFGVSAVGATPVQARGNLYLTLAGLR